MSEWVKHYTENFYTNIACSQRQMNTCHTSFSYILWAYNQQIKQQNIRAEGIRAAGIRAAGIRAAGIRAEGIRAEGIRAAGIRAAGIRAAGIRAAGIRAAGIRAALFAMQYCHYFNFTVTVKFMLSMITWIFFYFFFWWAGQCYGSGQARDNSFSWWIFSF